jgi:hypothetical protein
LTVQRKVKSRNNKQKAVDGSWLPPLEKKKMVTRKKYSMSEYIMIPKEESNFTQSSGYTHTHTHTHTAISKFINESVVNTTLRFRPIKIERNFQAW